MDNNRINSRYKKKVGGNWGGPRPDQKALRIDKVAGDRPEVAKPRGSKKYKERKPPKPWNACPFCEKELPQVLNDKEAGKLKFKSWRLFGLVARKCPCGSRQVSKGCPCCKGTTWYNKHTKLYKHERNGCGFVGVKLPLWK